MVDITLGFLFVNTVEELVVAGRAQCCNGQNLSLASCEHTGTVYAGQQVNFCSQRTDLVHCTAVNTLLLIQQPAANNILLGLVQALVDLCTLIRIDLCKVLVYLLIYGLEALVTNGLVVGIECCLYIFNSEVFDGLEHLFIRLVGGVRELCLADLCLNTLDELNDLLVFSMACHNAVEHILVRNFVSACLDHSDTLACGSNGNSHLRNLALLSCGVNNKLALNKAYGNTGDRSVPRNVGDGQSNAGADESGDFRRAIRVNRHNGADDGNVVAHVLGEQRTDRAVDHTANKNCLICGTAFSLQEGARDLTYGVELLLKVNRQREEIDAVTGLCSSGSGNMNGGFAVANKALAVSKLCHLTGFYLQRAAGKFSFKHSEIFKHGFFLSPEKTGIRSLPPFNNKTSAHRVCVRFTAKQFWLHFCWVVE